MSRRRLLTVYTSSSDDEDGTQGPQYENPDHPQPLQQQQQQHNDKQDVVINEAMVQGGEEEDEDIEIPSQNPIPNIDSVTLNSSHTSNSTTATTVVSDLPSVGISDEDFIDVSENLSPPSPLSPLSPPQVITTTTSFVSSDCPVNDHLRKMGLNLRREWLDSCKLGLQNTIPGFSTFDVETKAKLIFGQFLYSDMNYSGAGHLPENVHELHLVDLPGPFVLQVDEVINISCPLRERYKNAPPGLKRCLKLSMTDGVHRVFAMEYRPIKSIEALAPAGFKVVIQNVNIQRGLLMLIPEVLEILGGSVEELEAARQRLVQEVNKPPRGKRTRNGIVPSLSARATLAAWVQSGVSNEARPPDDANHVPGNTANSIHVAAHFRENASGVDPMSRIRQAPRASGLMTELPTSGRIDRRSSSREPAQSYISRETVQLHSTAEGHVLPTRQEAMEPLHARESAEHLSRETTQSSIRVDPHQFPTSTEAPEQGRVSEHTELNSCSATVIGNEDAHMVDYMKHPFLLTGERELPFVYLASLAVKWNALQEKEPFVQGKIKCFLTGVKRFQYKEQSTFELQVYVDDGSLISEIRVHHNVVQKAIGYSPSEVTAALSSSNTKVIGDMKDILKQFQFFLMNFEGTMLVEMNNSCTIPVALEMNQGCQTSDAWLLLKRLKPDISIPLCPNGQSDIIHLSP